MRRLFSGWGEIILKYISAVYLHQQVRQLKNTILHKWLSESSALGRGNLVPRVLSYPQEREPGNEVRGRGTQQPAPRANAFAYVTLCGREGILAFPMPSTRKWYSFHIISYSLEQVALWSGLQLKFSFFFGSVIFKKAGLQVLKMLYLKILKRLPLNLIRN